MKPYTLAEAEVEARVAIDDGDPDRIAAAERIVDRLDVRPPAATLHSAALWYTTQGLRVFPLLPGTKYPFKGSHGCLDATNDAAQVDAWWARTPDANVGIATGHSFDVVDVDGPAGQASRVKHWEAIFGRVDADSVGKVLTPRPGGMHIYVPATGEGNSTNIVPSVDYRGVGGYVVAPPSRTEQGAYQWLGEPRLTDLTRVA